MLRGQIQHYPTALSSSKSHMCQHTKLNCPPLFSMLWIWIYHWSLLINISILKFEHKTLLIKFCLKYLIKFHIMECKFPLGLKFLQLNIPWWVTNSCSGRNCGLKTCYPRLRNLKFVRNWRFNIFFIPHSQSPPPKSKRSNYINYSILLSNQWFIYGCRTLIIFFIWTPDIKPRCMCSMS